MIDPSTMVMESVRILHVLAYRRWQFFGRHNFNNLWNDFFRPRDSLSTYAKSFKEAQTYMSFLLIIVMIPAFSTMLMQPNDIPAYMFLVPVMNTLAAFKIVLGGSINYFYLLMALGSSLVYVGITLWLAATLFKKEKVLFRS